MQVVVFKKRKLQTGNAPPLWKEALRDDTYYGCVYICELRMKDKLENLRSSQSTQPKQLRKEILNGIRTHDLCDGGAVLYQLSYQANWELVIL